MASSSHITHNFSNDRQHQPSPLASLLAAASFVTHMKLPNPIFKAPYTWWTKWILHRKLMYYICWLIDEIVRIGKEYYPILTISSISSFQRIYLSISIQNTSISGVTFSRTTRPTQSPSKELFSSSENGWLKCSAAMCASAVQWNISPLYSRKLGKTLQTDSIL